MFKMYLLCKFVSLFYLTPLFNVNYAISRWSVNLTSIRWSSLTFLPCKRWSVSSHKPKTAKIWRKLRKTFTNCFSFVLRNNACVNGMLDVNVNTIKIQSCIIKYKNNRRDGLICWTCLFWDGTRGLVMPYNYIISRRNICRIFFLNELVQKGMLKHLPHVLLKSTDTKECVETFALCSLKKVLIYKRVGWHTRIF